MNMECLNCNLKFISTKPNKKFCSIKCRKEFHKNKTYEYINICPECNIQSIHIRKNAYGVLKNNLGNTKCNSCRQKGRIYEDRINYHLYDFWTDDFRYFRNCPTCLDLLEYKTKYYAYQACVNNSKCMSCSSYGLENGKIVETLRKYNVNTIYEYEQILPKKTLYYKKVWNITENQPIKSLENYNMRNGGGYALDHIYPIAAGFRNNIPAELIGNINNLQMLPRRINEMKSDKITIIPTIIQTYLDNI